MGERAFAGTGIRAFSAPGTLEELGEGAFFGCASLERVELGAALRVIGRGCFAESGLRGAVELPPSVVEVGEDAFLRCRGLRKVGVTADAQLERIGAGAFSETGLTMFLAPRALREVGAEAFCLCPALTYIQLNEGLQVLGERAFWGSGLQRLALPSAVRARESDAGRFISAGTRPAVLPEVAEISADICQSALERGVSCVVVPHCVDVIGAGAFAGFGALEEVVFARGSRLREVGTGAFRGCGKLARIRLPEGVRVREGAFEGTAFARE